ncbi:MAG TPA: YeeE/YedE family protein [Arenibaculum sp.]|nr:YeeE/YedE family protein [Arenibaculum sp.]
MTAFTPVSGTLGGALIGLAVVLLLLLNGRIAGISGILGGILGNPGAGDVAWRVAFLAGLVAAPMLYQAVAGPVAITIDASTSLLAGAGLLVGFGSRLGGGCTSGHGVCGFARRSRRSVAATGIFMAAGLLTVFVTRHLLGP